MKRISSNFKKCIVIVILILIILSVILIYLFNINKTTVNSETFEQCIENGGSYIHDLYAACITDDGKIIREITSNN